MNCFDPLKIIHLILNTCCGCNFQVTPDNDGYKGVPLMWWNKQCLRSIERENAQKLRIQYFYKFAVTVKIFKTLKKWVNLGWIITQTFSKSEFAQISNMIPKLLGEWEVFLISKCSESALWIGLMILDRCSLAWDLKYPCVSGYYNFQCNTNLGCNIHSNHTTYNNHNHITWDYNW